MTDVTSASTDEQRVSGLLDELLSELPPSSTKPATFLGAQYDKGLAWVHFPAGNGGLGLSPKLQKTINERVFAAGGPNPVARNPIGHGMCGPTVVVWGSDAQKQRYLRPLFTGEEVWCQLFSEPGSGSDLAGLKTRAEADGQGWRLTGQKIWTSFAHYADFGICLARTDPTAEKHQGLTMFLLNMRQKEVAVRPVPFSNGDHDFNEVFMDGAWVGPEDVLGQVNGGWKVAISTLMFERGTSNIHIMFRPNAEKVLALVKQRLADAPATLGNHAARQELARVLTRLKIVELHGLRTLAGVAQGAPPGPEGSLVKLLWSETNQRLAALGLDVLGPAGVLLGGEDEVPDAGWFPRNWLRSFGNTLEAGSSEILRNIMAERILGLPKDAARAAPVIPAKR